MDITSLVGIGIVGVIAAVTVKSYRAEIGVCVALAVGVVLFARTLPEISETIDALEEICKGQELATEYFRLIVKVTGIAYITQFASELAKDAGEGAISKKLELAGKMGIICVIMPTVKNLITIITDVLMSF